jgi:hypothetical protein
MLQYDFFLDPGEYRDVVISEEPYVKVMGDVGWSPIYNSYVAIAQVNFMICLVALKLKLDGKPLYISAADKSIHDTAARYRRELC